MLPAILFVTEEDATKAKELINEAYGNEKETINLEDYSLDELADIIQNPTEWHQSFLDAAVIELKKRKK
jgi:hypothetical protein